MTMMTLMIFLIPVTKPNNNKTDLKLDFIEYRNFILDSSKKFEFIINGTPVSQQTRRRERLKKWKTYVREEAEKYWSKENTIFTDSVMVQIIYFYDDIALDIDNIIKPILDAIIGLVYIDDAQITDIIIKKRYLFANFETDQNTLLLAQNFKRENEFLHVLITMSFV